MGIDDNSFMAVCYSANEDTPVFLSFRLSTFLYCLASILVSYIVYYAFVAQVGWEHKEKTLADHYTDMVQTAAYILILFTFGDYARSASWVTGVAYAVGLAGYGALVEVPFLRVGLPGIRSWPMTTCVFMVGALLVVLAGAGYHIYLATKTGILWPWYVVGLLIGMLIPTIGIVLVKLDHRHRRRNPPLRAQAQRTYSTVERHSSTASRHSTPEVTSPNPEATAMGENHRVAMDEAEGLMPPPKSAEGEGLRVRSAMGAKFPTLMEEGSERLSSSLPAPSKVVPRTRSPSLLSSSGHVTSPLIQQSQGGGDEERGDGSTGTVRSNEVPDARELELEERRGRCVPRQDDLMRAHHGFPNLLDGAASMLLGFRVHLHHWQIFYLLAFFTRFPEALSQVCAGLTIAAFMQGGIAYGFEPIMEPIYHYQYRQRY